MLKIFRRFLMGLCLVFVLSACGAPEDSSSYASSGMPSVDDILSEQMALEDGNTLPDPLLPDDDEASGSNTESDTMSHDNVDIDLTALSSTMIYAEIYNMVTTPLTYHGKTVKLTGYYDDHYDVMTDTLYASVFVIDALACCAQGLDLQFSDDYSYPTDYPTDGDEITVIGTFEIYYPDPETLDFYYHLVDVTLVH